MKSFSRLAFSAFRTAPRIRTRTNQSSTTRFLSGGTGASSTVFSTRNIALCVFSSVAAGTVYAAQTAETAQCAADVSLNDRLARVEIELAGKTNSAFVFIKPHACNEQVQDLVKKHFKSKGIRVTGEGTLDAKTIDEELLIDTHYGAIASKAVKLKPTELHVPDKGKEGFKKMFGISWEDALKSGKVYNAKDACAKLGISGAELEAQWAKIPKDTGLIKFGGGFYCGKMGDIFVMNGFYMSMRAAYTTPPAKIHYYTVQWPTDSLSWADFRGEVLGATNPKEAAPGSVRRLIFENYKQLGLSHQPNTGDNGVHASASPFEALAERANWLKGDITTDPFGRGLIAAGVSARTIREWSNDPQVTFEGKKGSLFDCLEDLDADDVLKRVQEIK